MSDPVKNFAKVIVSGGYSSSATSITLQTGEGLKLPQPSTDGAFNLVWWNYTDYPDPSGDPNKEIVRVTARTDDVLTVTRAQEDTGSTAKNLSGKTYFMALTFTKKAYDELLPENVTYVPLSGDISTYIANATAGDTLELGAGTYTITSDIVVNKSILIKGQGLSATKIVCATSNVKVFNITASNVRIVDLAITHTGSGTTYGVYANNNTTNVQIQGLIIIMNASGTKTCVGAINSSVTISNTECYPTSSDGIARGIYSQNDSSATINMNVNIQNSRVIANAVTDGYGIDFYNNNTAHTINGVVDKCSVIIASAGIIGYALYTHSTTTNNVTVIAYFTSLEGALIDAINGGTNVLTLHSCDLRYGNTGGTITIYGIYPLDTDGTLASNSDVKIASQKAVKTYSDNAVVTGLSRQAIINGNFDVWQRGTSFNNSGTLKYTSDRWVADNILSTYTVSRQDGTGVNGSRYCLRFSRDNGSTATTNRVIRQGVETSNAVLMRGKKLTLSFYARAGANYSPTSSTLNYIILSGTGLDESPSGYTGVSIIASGASSITTSWQKFTVSTESTVLSSVNEISVTIYDSPTGTAGAADYFEIAQVQLCAGDVALPFQPKSYEEELRGCLRYFERFDNQDQPVCNGFAVGTNSFEGVFYYTPKRANPVLSFSSANQFRVRIPGSASTCSAISYSTSTKTNCLITATATLTFGTVGYIQRSDASNPIIDVSADL